MTVDVAALCVNDLDEKRAWKRENGDHVHACIPCGVRWEHQAPNTTTHDTFEGAAAKGFSSQDELIMAHECPLCGTVIRNLLPIFLTERFRQVTAP